MDSIQGDVKWLGFDWDTRLYYASVYYEQLYDFCCSSYKKGKAYVCDLTADQMREYRAHLSSLVKRVHGETAVLRRTLTSFQRMRNGEFKDGERTLALK